jgi:protein-S-isoprenylcysteine O-methyltransferase Ste14
LVVIGAPLIELWSWNHLPGFRDLGYVLGLGSLVVFTFYGIWSYERTVRDEPGAIAMRDAIAATVIMLYLVLLSWAVFFSTGVSTTSPATDGSANQEPINKVTSELLTSFTSITAVVVAFYFGSVTIDQVTRHRQEPGKAAAAQDAPPEKEVAGSNRKDSDG